MGRWSYSKREMLEEVPRLTIQELKYQDIIPVIARFSTCIKPVRSAVKQ